MTVSPQAAYAASTHLAAHPAFLRAKAVAAYCSIRDEFDTRPLLATICETKRCYLPVLTEEAALLFVRYQPGDALKRNTFGIFEPSDHREVCDPKDLDLVLLPLLAFDALGHRLGMGGGYYDRTFQFVKTAPSTAHRPHLAGLAYALQEADHLPVDPWDVSLDSVITERGYRLFS